MRVLVAGATGYVGSRLVPALVRAGLQVRATSRRPESLLRFDWIDDVEAVTLDATDPASAAAAMDGVDVVYYLVHGLGSDDFAATDRLAAETIAAAAEAAAVDQLIYLGGLVPEGERLSEHLESRAEVGDILAASATPTVQLRAAVIVGAGSTSFEIIRYVADRLLVIPAPRWMSSRVQPVAIDDVLYYLVAALDLPPGAYDIGGEDVMSYRELIARYTRSAGLTRPILDVPGPISPWLAATVLGRLTPVPSALTGDLIESLANTMVVADDRIRTLVPDPPGGLTGVDEAIGRALAVTTQDHVEGAAATDDSLALTDTDPPWAGGDVYRSTRSRIVPAPVAAVWAAIDALPSALPASWRMGGLLSRLSWGPSLRWTRSAVAQGSWLRLEAVSAQGRGVVIASVAPDGDASALTVSFTWKPSGLRGQAFWWASSPWQAVLLPELLRSLSSAAVAAAPTPPTPPTPLRRPAASA